MCNTIEKKNDNNNHNDDGNNEVEQQQRPPNPFQQANWYSRLFFTWPYPLLKLGMERVLDDNDLPEILQHDTSKNSLNYFNTIWENEKRLHPHSPSLRRALAKDYFKSVWYAQPLMCAASTAKVAQAILLGKLVDYLSTSKIEDDNDMSNNNNNNNGYLYAGLIVLCGMIILFEHHHLFFLTWRKGMQIRISCIAAIYDKSTRLSSIGSHNTSSAGKIMNLASNDVERFLLAALFINYLFWAPIQSIAILYVGYTMLGVSFIAGFCLLILIFIPLQMYLGGMFAYYRSKIAAITDQRVTFVSQAIRGSRVMKMSCYEQQFLHRIMSYRQNEISKITKANTLKSWNEALFFSTNVVISLVIFIVHVTIMGNTLNEGDVFTVFTLINILQLEMTKHVSLAVMATSECYVSIGRIQQFLQYPELDVNKHTDTMIDNNNDNNEEEKEETNNKEIAISLKNVKCYWNGIPDVDDDNNNNNNNNMTTTTNNITTNITSKDLRKIKKQATNTPNTTSTDDEEVSETDSLRAITYIPALRNVTVNFYKGDITTIIGPVGGGKSALIQTIVNELPISSGIILRNYTNLAYAAQDAWIMDGTVRDNILMGLEYNEHWYNEVITACALQIDLQQFSHGDATILGDRGVNCSGGQRARIGLARAIYRNTDILIADDPLSAVDAKVGRQLYQDALLGLVVKRGKTVILATHQHQYVYDCRCVLVTGGRIDCIGTYEECVKASNGKLHAHAADSAIDDLMDDDNVDEKDTNYDENGELDDKTHNNENSEEKKAGQNEDKKDGKEDHKEMNRQGTVEADTYLNYLRAMGGVWVGGFLFILFSATQGSVLYTIATVGNWAKRDPERQNDWDIIGLVIGLGCLVIFFALFRSFISFYLTIKASQRLHDRMAKAVLRAKIQFFDTNPLGRILNRFSADVGITDDLLPPTLFDFFMLAFIVLGAVATTISTLPFVLIALPFLGWYFYSVRKVFVTSSRELKRLEGIARSPIFAMLSESLGGIATIRANDAVDFFKKKFQDAHDTHTRCFFAFIAASRWVGFRMDSLVFLFLVIVSFLSVLFNEQGWFEIDPAILGLSLSMLLQLAGLFQWCIRQSAEVVNQMVSVERILAFGNIESEAQLELEADKQLEQNWPEHGQIKFDNLSIRYRESLPLALKDVSFCIPAGSRCGIVGRTGSGKSTVVQTLFRLLEAEQGQILIDGVDVSKLGLHALRSKISVIPQVPTLFSGCSVRENLDLFGLHSEESIQKVIENCHLKEVIDDLPQGLDSPVSEGGSNFSVGQRQLLCLARAILSTNKILVLDEATASVDRRTDQLLQQALHESFQDGTILAVAHRLDTIIDFDYCLVLGSGKVLEFGSPAELIRSGGVFASMVADTGDAMSIELKQLAFQQEKAKNTFHS